jgi:hypothetical protein
VSFLKLFYVKEKFKNAHHRTAQTQEQVNESVLTDRYYKVPKQYKKEINFDLKYKNFGEMNQNLEFGHSKAES